jgi:hypothetical protein
MVEMDIATYPDPVAMVETEGMGARLAMAATAVMEEPETVLG